MEVHITLYNRTDPLTHLRDGIVESAPKLELHLMELETEPLGYRLSLDGKAPSLAVDSTDMSKAEEIKSLRLSQTLPFAACGSKFSKLEEPRLLRVQAETESAHPLFDVPEKPLSLRLVLKPEDKVIGVPNDNDIAPCVSPAPLMYPQIKDIVQVNIGKQGRDYRPLRGPHFRLGPSAFLHDSCAEPFSDKSQKSSVGNSMLKKLHEPSVFDGVEETADVCIEHPIDPLLRDGDVKRVQRMMSAAPWSKPVGEAQEIFLVDGIENGYHCTLCNLVLQSGNPQETELAVCLRYITPLGWLSMVSSPVDALAKIGQALLQTIFVLAPCHSVYPGGRTAFKRIEALPKEVDCDMVQ